MDILVVAATEEETRGIDFQELNRSTPHYIEKHITGVGMVATTYSLAKIFDERKFDVAVNIGLAGSFNDKYKIGEVVNVSSDCFADLGAEDDEQFLTLNDLGLMDKSISPFKEGLLIPETLNTNEILELQKVKGITVNKVHGNEKSILQVKTVFNADVESMEGAAFFYVCMMEQVPCIQLRAISNKVEKRNKDKWNIPLALENLGSVVTQILTEINFNHEGIKDTEMHKATDSYIRNNS